MAKRATKTAVETTELTTYKGFNKYWKCRDYQYEIGGTYKHDGDVVRCAKGGFHSCELPLDVFNYYGPATSKFAMTIASGLIDRETESDTKIASGEITIKAELNLPHFIRKSVEWIVSKAGDKLTSGRRAHAASTGDYAHAASTGNGAHAASTGDYAHAASTGRRAHAASTGRRAHAASTGDYAHAASTGDYAHAASTGNGAHAASTGDYAHAASTGRRAHAASTGRRAHAASTGNGAIAAALGVQSTASASKGGAITLAAYDESVWPPKLVAVRSSMVGENGIEAGKRYWLTVAGEFELVEG